MRYLLILVMLLGVNKISSQIVSNNYRDKSLTCVEKTFTVVVHLLKDSLGGTNMDILKINEIFDTLNSAFKPICVSFKLSNLDTLPEYQFDTITSIDEFVDLDGRFHKNRRINLYLVSRGSIFPIQDSYATPNGYLEMSKGGILFTKNPYSANTIVNSFGTFFGLLPTEGNGNELVNGSNCATAGDLICDTPAEPGEYDDKSSILDGDKCVFLNKATDKNGQFYRPDVGNYMSKYYVCHCGFSRQQFQKMADNIINAPLRLW